MNQSELLEQMEQYDAEELAALEAALQTECEQALPDSQTIKELTDAIFALTGSGEHLPQMKAECIAAMRKEQHKSRRHIRLHRIAAVACAGLILVLSANVFTLSRYRVNAFSAMLSLFSRQGQDFSIPSEFPDIRRRTEDWLPTLTVPEGYPIPMQPAYIPEGMKLCGYGWGDNQSFELSAYAYDFSVSFRDGDAECSLQYSFLREPSDVPEEIPLISVSQHDPLIPEDAENDTVMLRGTETDVYYWKTNQWKSGGFVYAARFYYNGVVYSINVSGLADGELQQIVESFV